MDWWKLFGGTFVLIFLAELGDKTQLAAMAKTADAPDSSMSKWVVFLGASLALVASTFIAVFLGHLLKAVVPDERYIKIAAAILFLIFGFSILYETVSSFRGANAPEEAAAVVQPSGQEQEKGLAGGLALRAAMDFEALSMERYRKMAEEATPELSSVLLDLAAEEEDHLRYLRGMPPEERGDAVWESRASADGANKHVSLRRNNAEILAALIGGEEATADFYRQLSQRTLIPSVRTALSRLADEEMSHAKRLRELGENKIMKA
jgi:rubrerythrin